METQRVLCEWCWFNDTVTDWDTVALMGGERMTMGHWWNQLTGENRNTRRETCPSATLSTTNPMDWPGIECEPPLWGAGQEPPKPWPCFLCNIGNELSNFLLFVPYIYVICTVHLCYLYRTFMLFVPYIYAICTVHLCYLYRTFMLFVSYIYAICIVHLCYLYRTFMLFVPYIYAICTVYFLDYIKSCSYKCTLFIIC
jgi:hypothetical protein